MPEETSIESIVVIPRNKDYAAYYINDGSKHTMRYSDLRKFLIKLVPIKPREITDLTTRFANFLVLPKEQEIIELAFDEATSYAEAKKDLFEKELGGAAEKIENEDNDTTNDKIDNTLEQISKKLFGS